VEEMRFFIGQVMPYMTAGVFLSGIVYRLRRWSRAARGSIPLYPIPSTRSARWKRIIGEILVFKSLFEGERSLWIGTWVFHTCLGLIIIGHVNAISELSFVWEAIHAERKDLEALSAVVGSGAGLIIFMMGIYLLMRRIVIQRVKEISGKEDYMALLLILAIIITGNMMRFVTNFDPAASREYFAGFAAFGSAKMPADPFFALHFFLGQVWLMYIPFSKFLHIPGVFYSKSIIYQE
jgi:nitrate reductase gamma subunit